MEQRYIDFFLKRKSNIGGLDTIELSHPSFTQTHYLVRNHLKGFVGTISEGVDVEFKYCPMSFAKSSVKDDLDSSIEINLGDVGQYVNTELRNIERDNSYDVLPTLIYRVYRSDDLTRPLFPAIIMEVEDITYTHEGSLITAKSQSLNVVGTGEKYDLNRFKMLRGVV